MTFNYYTIIIGALIGFILFFKLPRLKKTKNVKTANLKISVIIPARNEEKNLLKLLPDLMNQTYDIHEIICVDDNSEDNTLEVIRNAGVKCVQLNGLPSGWKGKPWACQKGAEAATGEVLIFLDADVSLSSTAIESLVRLYQQSEKPISVLPYHAVKKQHEYFSLFFNIIKICGTAMSILGIKKNYGLYGPVFMLKTTLFEKHGGFKVVKESVTEDLNLGRYYTKQNIDVNLYLGGKDIHFQMYPNSFKDVIEGWSKNFSSGAITIQWWQLIMIFTWLAYLTAVPIEITKSIVNGDTTMLILLGAIYIISVAILYRIVHCVGSYPIYVCIFYPVYLVAFHIIFIYSIYKTFISKTTTWKGRQI